MKELLEEAAILLSDVNNFGADDSVRRARITRWLAKYEAAQQSVQPTVLTHSPNCALVKSLVADCNCGFDKSQSG